MRKVMMVVLAAAWLTVTASGAAWCGDNGNGTVTVNGLVWLKDAGCSENNMNWYDATARARTLANGQCGLTDKSNAGDWRLPTKEELQAVYSVGGQFKNVHRNFYWSSSHLTFSTVSAWAVNFNGGYVSGVNKYNYGYVWPVRSGQ